MEKMITKRMNKMKDMLSPKNLPRVIMLLIILAVLYFVYQRFLKEGYESFQSESTDLHDKVKSGTKLVLFYADWCGHCNKVKPDWDKAANDVNKGDVKMIKVNCGEGTENDQQLMKKYNIDGYPTIIKFVNGTPSLYRGDRDSDSFKEMFKNQNN